MYTQAEPWSFRYTTAGSSGNGNNDSVIVLVSLSIEHGRRRRPSLLVSLLAGWVDVRRQRRTDDITDLAYYLTDWHDADGIITTTSIHTIELACCYCCAALDYWSHGRA